MPFSPPSRYYSNNEPCPVIYLYFFSSLRKEVEVIIIQHILIIFVIFKKDIILSEQRQSTGIFHDIRVGSFPGQIIWEFFQSRDELGWRVKDFSSAHAPSVGF